MPSLRAVPDPSRDTGEEVSVADDLAAGVQFLIAADASRDPASVRLSVERIRGGLSREAWRVEVRTPDIAGDYVLLMNSPDGLIESDPATEFELLEQIHPRGALVPRPVWLDATGAFLGKPGYLMSLVRGSADVHRLNSLSTAKREILDGQFVRVMADLHAVTPLLTCVSSWDTPSPEAAVQVQVARWQRMYEAMPHYRDRGLSLALEWLAAKAPAAHMLTLVHGDYRYGNLLVDQGQLTAVLDWELSHWGDPIEDLVWSLRPYRPGTGVLWPVEEFLTRYEAAAAVELDRAAVAFHRVFAEIKTAIIYLRGLQAFVRDGARDLSTAVPAQIIPYCVRQALTWIDALEAANAEVR